jgi:hypothetical protein
MAKISETLDIGGEVVNVHVEIAERPEPEPISAPVVVESRDEAQKRQEQKLTKLSTPAAQPNPGAKPSTDAATNGKIGGVLSMPDWVAADRAWKESTPLPVSDGGRGVSN